MSDKKAFCEALTHLINTRSLENGSNTPDHILARHLTECLIAFDTAVKDRDRWYGKPEKKSPKESQETGSKDEYTAPSPNRAISGFVGIIDSYEKIILEQERAMENYRMQVGKQARLIANFQDQTTELRDFLVQNFGGELRNEEDEPRSALRIMRKLVRLAGYLHNHHQEAFDKNAQNVEETVVYLLDRTKA